MRGRAVLSVIGPGDPSGAARPLPALSRRAVGAAPAPPSAGTERLRLAHRALPGRDLAEVDLRATLLGAALDAPVLVAVDGGAPSAALRRAVAAACEHGVGLVVGERASRLAEPPALRRPRAGDRPRLVLAELAATSIAAKDGAVAAERLVASAAADGLSLTLDPVGDAVRGGGTGYGGLDAAIAAVVERLAPMPVLVRAGGGMDAADARILARAGVAAVDVGIEERPAPPWSAAGVPVLDAVAETRLAAPAVTILAGGRAADGVETAICLALGADGACIPAARLEDRGEGAAAEALGEVIRQLRIAVWATGAGRPDELHPGHLRRTAPS